MVSRLQIASSGVTIVGTSDFKIRGRAYLSWISKDTIIIPYSNHGIRANQVGVWQYPKGGKALERFKHFSDPKRLMLSGVTLSVLGS